MIEPKDLKDTIKKTQGSTKPDAGSSPESSVEPNPETADNLPQVPDGWSSNTQPVNLEDTDVVAEVLALETIPKNVASTDLETQIVTLALQGETPIRIAKSLGLSIRAVRGFLVRPEVQEYLEKMRDAMSTYSQLLVQDTLTKILEARLEELEESGESMANFSEKDSLEILRELQNVSNNIQKNKKDTESGNVFLNIYSQLIS